MLRFVQVKIGFFSTHQRGEQIRQCWVIEHLNESTWDNAPAYEWLTREQIVLIVGARSDPKSVSTFTYGIIACVSSISPVKNQTNISKYATASTKTSSILPMSKIVTA